MKILVYPKDSNPYQELLYSKFGKPVTITYLENPTRSHTLGLLLLPVQLVIYRLMGYKIFHLHWVFRFQIPLKQPFFHNYFFRLIFSIYFLFFLSLIKLLGYKLVWTVHDLFPHEKYFIDNKSIVKFLSKLCDAKIVHSYATLQIMRRTGFNTSNTKVIPVGNYIGVYPNTISRKKAKNILKIPFRDFVFGFFGKIEKYKGIYSLIDSFNSLNLKNTKLLIAGFCTDDKINQFLIQQSIINPNILLSIKFIPDDDVQLYMNSTNIFVYPFTEVTSSSSVILAMSFRKPVISTLVGEIKNMPKNTGFYYRNYKHQSKLINLMKAAFENKAITKTLGENAYHFIKSIQWRDSSKLTTRLYKKLILSN